ncbi:MAG: pyridoxal phosphate-dependent aminotransferase [Gammaproteobacteria bacterium]
MTTNPELTSRAVAAARLSAIKEMAMLSARIPDAASLAWGLPSFRTPAHIRDAVTSALADDPDIGKYALPNGLAELRRAAADRHLAKTGVTADPDEHVFITAGNMQGMHSLFRALLDPGDEVLLTDPGFASHFQQILLAGGTPVSWPLDEDAGWRLDPSRLEDLLTPRTKAVVLVNPCNPTGTLFEESELIEFAGIVARHNLVVVIDDPYSEILYENRSRFYNLASYTGLRDRLAYLFTFSKIYAMSGWRLGYMIVPDWLRAGVLKVHDANMICTPRISQVAGIAALTGPQTHQAEFERILAGRRELICARLDRVPHVFQYHRPEGAYYVFPRIVADHADDREFALRLLNEAHVAVTPGSAFGPAGESHVRMAFCVDNDAINLAFDRIEQIFGA